MFQELEYNHFLTIILHANGSDTQVQWHFLSDWEGHPWVKDEQGS